MNRENVEKLRDHLRDAVTDEQFRMDEFECGTAACIAGWSVRLFGEGHYETWDDIAYDALIMPPGYDEPNHREVYSRARAVATLTRLLETGKVDWGSQ